MFIFFDSGVCALFNFVASQSIHLRCFYDTLACLFLNFPLGAGGIKKPRCYIEAFEYYLFSTGNAITSPNRSLCATTNDYLVIAVSFLTRI